MVSGIENETPHAVRLFWAQKAVELERGEIEYIDTYHLAKLILYGNENEGLVANEEWRRRTKFAFPYHPSFKRNKYPINKLR